MEFLAEKELVTIIPNFSLDKIYLIGVRVRARHLPRAGAGGPPVSVPKSRMGSWVADSVCPDLGGQPGGGEVPSRRRCVCGGGRR